MLRQFHPQNVSSRRPRNLRSFQEMTRDRLAVELYLCGQRLAEAAQIAIIAARLDEFGDRELWQRWRSERGDEFQSPHDIAETSGFDPSHAKSGRQHFRE